MDVFRAQGISPWVGDLDRDGVHAAVLFPGVNGTTALPGAGSRPVLRPAIRRGGTSSGRRHRGPRHAAASPVPRHIGSDAEVPLGQLGGPADRRDHADPAARQSHPGRSALSYQHIINGLGTQCAPSRALYSSDPNLTIREAPALNIALQRGWAVALPDHLGPTSAYGAARLGGQITLDGIRAAKNLPELGLTNSRVTMAGYSGGGMATAWAAALAPTYAPELDIAGVAAGGVPMNISKMAKVLGDNPHPAFGLAMAAALGLEREYPDRFPLSSQLNAQGLAIRDKIANGCTNEIMAFGAGHSAPELASTMQMTSDPGAWEIGDENSLELYPGVPTSPMYEWHATNDVLIPIDAIDNTIARYCGAGARIWSEKFLSPDHLTTAVFGLPAAMDYLDQRIRGVPAPSNCPPS